MENSKFVCPVLRNPDFYNPDTIDLVNDVSARTYWLTCLDSMTKKFVNKAGSLNPKNPTATEDAEISYKKFHQLVERLEKDPTILKSLSIRKLLEINEDNLRENNLRDAWLSQKIKESEQALLEFSERIKEIDSSEIFEEKWLEIIKGVLSGNVFDWGSSKVSDILESTPHFGFKYAMKTIQKRPWFHDDLDLWIKHLKDHPYKSVAIFVDNAGVDFILGILPLTREFLKQGTKVILTANSSPALNDVTYDELNLYCCQAAKFCTILKNSIANRQLITVENGQKGPCLDLSDIPEELAKLMSEIDLIVLEGMGRAVHTNLNAKFTIDCLKLAVLKNEWLAKSLGAEQFSVICDFEQAI